MKKQEWCCLVFKPYSAFKLIAVFNTRFHDFSSLEQILHLVALLLIAFAIALIMAPAAYHRIAERGIVSRRFVDFASRFLELALMPLMFGISLDLFLLGRLILNNAALSALRGDGARADVWLGARLQRASAKSRRWQDP